MRTSNSTNGNLLKIVEKKKIWFLIPAAIALLTAISLLVYTFVATPINMGMDLAGGYYITVKSTQITEDNYNDYIGKIEDIATSLENEDGDRYGLVIDSTTQIGSGSNSLIYINYKAVKGLSTTEMTELGESFEVALRELFTHINPIVSLSGSVATITYERTVATFATSIEQSIKAAYPSADLEWVNPAPSAGTTSTSEQPYNTELKVLNAGSIGADVNGLVEAARVVDEYSAKISEADTLSGSVSPDLINYTIAAGVIAIVVAFAYAVLRMRKASAGVSAALGMLLDICLLLCIMIICHIELTGLFLAVGALVLVFSMYNKMLVFVRIKENVKKNVHVSGVKMAEVVDTSINELFQRSVYTLAGVMLMTVAVAIGALIAGLAAVAWFALTLMIGLVVSTFTTFFITPCIWQTFNKTLTKPKEKAKSKHKEVKTI